MRAPKALLPCWQAVLAACLLLPVLQPWRPVSTGNITRAISTVTLGRAPAISGPGFPSPPLLLATVAAGILFRSLWLALGYWKLSRYRRAARPLNVLPAGLADLQRKLGVRADLWISTEVGSPVTFGFRRPTVLLPVRWDELDPREQQSIACHELLHVRRGDWAFHMAEEMIRALLWFHPAVWWIVSQIRLTREQVVDRAVVELTSAHEPYIQALVAFARTRGRREMIAAPAFSRRRHLVQRVALILEEITMSRFRLSVSLGAITVCLIAACLLAIRSFPLMAPHRALAASPQNRYVHHVGEPGVVAPRVLYKEDPQYTQSARDAKIQGTVVVQLEVTANGLAESARIESGRGLDPGLDQNALDAIANWRFQPATKDGEPVMVEAIIEINYRLL